ncbi:TIGR02679 family protein [Nonomuraea sp. NPDC050404]|uniref:TIGR02679 family protein n=1 Tax=Nonomuraea sp. NPDC050404 TaxID=3155783 RepID=UPI0033CE2937
MTNQDAKAQERLRGQDADEQLRARDLGARERSGAEDAVPERVLAEDVAVPERLRVAGLRPVWAALHARLCSGQRVSRFRVTGLDDGQQAAVADLLGLDRYPGPAVTIDVARLEGLLGLDARTVAEAVIGPIDDRRRRQAERRQERQALLDWFATHPVVVAQPALLALSGGPTGAGGGAPGAAGTAEAAGPSGADGAAGSSEAGARGGAGGLVVRAGRGLVGQALDVLAALPASGRPLAAVAAEVTGDPHALDEGTRLAALVLKGLAILYDVDAPEGAQARRALWERAGVACDALSTTVLVAGLRPRGDTVLARVLRLWDGQPSVITLAQLHDVRELPLEERDAYVVENPTVLALAAQRYGAACPPMICTSGWPNSAAIRLLRALTGTRLHYHGDFDGAGLRIAAYTMAKTGAVPWRMSTADYLRALADCPPTGLAPGKVTDAPWDAELAGVMRERGVAVPEELVAGRLLDDIRPQNAESF